PCKLHFDDLHYLLRLIQHCLCWFLDEQLHLLEHNRFLSVHFTTIHHALKHAETFLKKLRCLASERNEDLHADFVHQMTQYTSEQLGFIDEVSKNERSFHQWMCEQ
ncbi:uncharacterized protein LAESUDRAFT_665107, partial [Laetiporus sulphureus 93-53]